MSYLDNSSQDASPSFLQALARSLGLGGSQPPQPPNRAALASALSGQPLPPPGTHYAQLPGPPLLLPDSGDAVTVGRPAPPVPPTAVPAAGPAPGTLATMRGAVSDIPGASAALAAGQNASPASSGPAAAKAVVVPGYEAKGPLTRAQVSAAPDDDKTMPAEEDWDQAAAKAGGGPVGTQVAQATPSTPAPMSAYEQTLKARFDQQEQLIRTTTNPEVAKMAIAEANKINDELSAFRKPGSRVLTSDELTPAERATGAEYQLSPTGDRSQVAGTAADTTRDPTSAEAAKIMAAGGNPKEWQVKDGQFVHTLAPAAGTTDVENWKAENADNVTRGLPQISLHDFLGAKRANAGVTSNTILGKDGNPIDENLTGEDVYKAVPPTVARMAKGMVEGLTKIPNMSVRTDPTAKQAFLVAQQADPSLLDVNKVSARHEIEAGYARSSPGTLGGQVNAGNTAADHLADVIEAANDLKNVSGGGVPLIAHIANNLRNNISTGQAGKAGALEDGLLHYGEEIAKFYAGSQTGETERLRFLTALGSCKSPEEIAGVFRMEARQLGGKFITLDDQVRTVMGDQAAAKYPVVRGATKENASRITKGLATLDPVGPEATSSRSPTDAWPGIHVSQARAIAPEQASQNAPPAGFTKGGYRFKGGDPSQQNNWEKVQ